MKLIEAIMALTNTECTIRRRTWAEKEWIYKTPAGKFYTHLSPQVAGVVCFNVEDFLAEDWSVNPSLTVENAAPKAAIQEDEKEAEINLMNSVDARDWVKQFNAATGIKTNQNMLDWFSRTLMAGSIWSKRQFENHALGRFILANTLAEKLYSTSCSVEEYTREKAMSEAKKLLGIEETK